MPGVSGNFCNLPREVSALKTPVVSFLKGFFFPGTGLFPVGLLLIWLLNGCAGLPLVRQLERSTAEGNYSLALETLEKQKAQFGGANSLLYYFEKGGLLQRLEDYAGSNAALDQAELLIEQLQGTSVTESAASLLVNDMTLSYSGEDYEQVMVHLIKALNFFYLQDFNGAQVEARKVNNRLLAISDKYGKEAVYREDAFARYLAALAYEAGGAYNDAYIDYKKSYQAYQAYARRFGTSMPGYLAGDLLRLSRWVGFDDEYQQWRDTFGGELPDPGRRPLRRSELLLVIYDGQIPLKRTDFIEAPIRDRDHKPYLLKVAFPAFRRRVPVVASAGLEQADGQWGESAFVMEPLGPIAVKNLEQRLGLISAKAIARATAKYLAAQEVRRAARSGNEGVNWLVGLAANVYTVATEQADTRSWETLPYRFWLLRKPLPPGTHEVNFTWERTEGGERRSHVLSVTLKPGEKKVIPVYIPN